MKLEEIYDAIIRGYLSCFHMLMCLCLIGCIALSLVGPFFLGAFVNPWWFALYILTPGIMAVCIEFVDDWF